MNEEQKQEAAELGKRAARQSKHAAKNGLRAVRHSAEAAVDAAADEVHDTAQKAEATVEDAVRSIKGSDLRLAAALTGVFLGGTYLLGRVAGYRQAKRMTEGESGVVHYRGMSQPTA